jgi:N-formylglutamate amidohydrolase
MRPPFLMTRGDGPLVAAAIHAGHELRPEVARLVAVDEATRLREEDPFTDRWVDLAGTRVVVRRSRFEVDLNRPRERAVYHTPEDAWGIRVWPSKPAAELVDASLAIYDEFYGVVRQLLDELLSRCPAFLVLDLHSYCHRRGGPDVPHDAPEANPEINLGTATVDRAAFGAVVDAFVGELRQFDFHGRSLDVRENVRFRGGHFSSWINRRYPGAGCAVAVEVKKIFMDEWSGELDERVFDELGRALAAAAAAALDRLERR